MPRLRFTMDPLDELRLQSMGSGGEEPLRLAGDGALVRLADGTLGVVATFGQSSKRIRLLTEDRGAILVDQDAYVQVLAHPVLAAKLLIYLARTIAALDQADPP